MQYLSIRRLFVFLYFCSLSGTIPVLYKSITHEYVFPHVHFSHFTLLALYVTLVILFTHIFLFYSTLQNYLIQLNKNSFINIIKVTPNEITLTTKRYI